MSRREQTLKCYIFQHRSMGTYNRHTMLPQLLSPPFPLRLSLFHLPSLHLGYPTASTTVKHSNIQFLLSTPFLCEDLQSYRERQPASNCMRARCPRAYITAVVGAGREFFSTKRVHRKVHTAVLLALQGALPLERLRVHLFVAWCFCVKCSFALWSRIGMGIFSNTISA